jgi:predicted nucleotidyltransferase
MTAQAAIALDEAERALVLQILNAALPPGVTVSVFGSRATGRARRYSDLDLSIDAGRPLTRDETAALADAFEESDLPWRVDLIDLHMVSEAFRGVIARDALILTITGQDSVSSA